MTPTKQEMIDKIYEVIADKTLSFGCRIMTEWDIVKFLRVEEEMVLWPTVTCLRENEKIVGIMWFNVKNIIWHPVMIWDVFDFLYWSDIEPPVDYTDQDVIEEIFVIWKEKRKPIEDQSIECIEFIYSLLPKN